MRGIFSLDFLYQVARMVALGAYCYAIYLVMQAMGAKAFGG